ncbi:MAG: hypothetical protein AABZ31_01505 [Bdellovibrionota bacterium]
MKSIFGLLALIIFPQAVQATSFGCEVQSSLNKKISYTLMIDNKNETDYAVQSTNKASGTSYRSYYFDISGELSKKKINVVVAASGIVGRWTDATEEESEWNDVSFARTGYIKATAGVGSRKMTGIASLPFIENGAQVKVTCDEAVEPSPGCVFCN